MSRHGGDVRAALRSAGVAAACSLALTAPGGGDAPESRPGSGLPWAGADRGQGSRHVPGRWPATDAGAGASASAGRPGEAAEPVRLRIPAIGVAAPVEPLAVGRDRELPPPRGHRSTGWWREGPEPGEPGPAVLVGHYDSGTGPAVFHRLAALRPGDRVDVDRADGSSVSFTVRRLTAHPQDAFPADRVYGGTGGRPALRLITCDGTYDRAAGRYSGNLVVFAEAEGRAGARDGGR